MDPIALWKNYKQLLCDVPSVGLKLDTSRVGLDEAFLDAMDESSQRALSAMAQLEAGAIANPDEKRMVGHYWLRAPELAPTPELKTEIESTVADVKAFAADVHAGRIKPATSPRFTDVLLIGIGGSALGPQLVADALGTKRDKLRVHYLDNTDPDGFDRVFDRLGSKLRSTLIVVISKSGGTKETRNGMVETQTAFAKRNLDLPAHAVAVTGVGSELDKEAVNSGWIKRFPMWDWVGGRTSVMSAVGLLPMALQGLDITAFLDGAAEMDRATRITNARANPAMMLALAWHRATAGKGTKDLVVLPYKDRLLLMSRYLQQLIMESLGKEHDLSGNTVNQGLAVYGNKGSTDQHAFVQQLRDGLDNFFVTFIVVLRDRATPPAKANFEVEPGVTSGDYLNGFWQGTRQALTDKGRLNMTITLEKIDAHALGALIALHERAVGLYASLVNINAYHQPGVEAGKKAATAVLSLQQKVVKYLTESARQGFTVEEIATAVGQPASAEAVHHILEHLVANRRGIVRSGAKFKAK
jgi:glucose-6-phosphate isomerase